MKKTILYILLLCAIVTYSQRQASNWYFGENAGIRFTSAGNVIPLSDGRLNTKEGCSSISDNNGNLLFYTDGSTVYNRLHNVMINGTGLLGNESSSQSAIVVPKPDDPDIYYIFTVGSNATATGLKYSVVDMSLDMGRGQITLKNVNLLSQCAEKIAAVLKDCETGSIWVIGLSNFSGTAGSPLNTFHAFEVTASGINTVAVRSNYGSSDIIDQRGYLKLSPDGTKVICANVDNGLDLFNFDVNTGIISGRQRLNIPSPNNQPYGAEFSPNSQVLYVTAYNDANAQDNNPSSHQSVLVQYDLTVANISTSAIIIDNRNLYRSALQLGPNGKIYRSMASSYNVGLPFLSTINNPNQLGSGCDYQHNSVSLGNNNSTQGLPPFIASFFTERIDIIRNGSESTFLPLCTGDSYTLTADNIPGATYMWFLNGRLLTETDFDLIITGPGTYEVIINLNTDDCDRLEGEAIVEYFDIPIANPTTNILICDDNNDDAWDFDLTIKNPDILGTQDPAIYSVHYFRSQIDAENNDNELLGTFTNTINPTTIYARIHNDGNPNCYDITTFTLTVFKTPIANTVPTQEVCDNDDDGDDTNGQIIINLQDYDTLVLNGQNASDYTITYHSSQLAAENGTGDLPTSYYNQITFQEELFVRIENNLNTTCFETTSFIVNVNPIPEAFNASLVQCDEDGIVDGITTFNLNEANDIVTGGETNVFTEVYPSLLEAENGQGILDANAYINNSNPEIVFVKVINSTTGCYSIAELTLEVSTTQINDYVAPPVCDDVDSEDGINSFDLNAFTTDIQTLNGITFPVSYYATYNDALLEQNELSSPFINTIPYNQTIYSRVENANACYGIGEVELTINVLPQLEDDDTMLYCLNTFPDTIMINAGIVNDDPSNYTYNWSSGQDTYEIAINQTGIYTVTVTNSFGCSKTRSITVEPSNTATFQSIDVVDATENNSITVIVSGEGDYEYALYDQYGLYTSYQTSNTFYNVYPGIYTVSVRDVKNNCGIVEELVSVIGFPKFFTPNNDGDNDTWNVKGLSGMFQPNTRILIFDRYGKLLKELDPLGEGWDGTFNGNALPVSDYWFSVKLQDGRTFNSHFTLKR